MLIFYINRKISDDIRNWYDNIIDNLCWKFY